MWYALVHLLLGCVGATKIGSNGCTIQTVLLGVMEDVECCEIISFAQLECER